MKQIFFFFAFMSCVCGQAQKTSDSLYRHCPVSVVDTLTGNNYFIERQPAQVKVYRIGGDLRIVVEQRNQFFTIMFHLRKLKNKAKYTITSDAAARDEVTAKYSFKSGDDVAYIDVSSGKVETTYDKVTKLWRVKLTGLIANLGESRVSYFKATADILFP
ncbi:MAG TPA: hypothetical protein PK023_05165 [Chitinophagaceae bacterium]|nr:hypothetical protein [Chitinophagaceae bacterium]HND94940.1 hypothetical protein [Chitinophagaceae bacterium]